MATLNMTTSNPFDAPLSFREAQALVEANIQADDLTPQLFLGPPGCGKTDLAIQVAVNLGLPRDLVVEHCLYRPSLHDPVDLMGVPYVHHPDDTKNKPMTRWAINAFLRKVNAIAAKYGSAVLIWDEMAQAVPAMQNAINGLLLDRTLGEFKLHPRVFQVATGNRTEDRAGSGRILTHTANRLEVHTIQVSHGDWHRWALEHGIAPELVMFMRFKPEALFDFDPSRTVNATPRSWASLAKYDLPPKTPEGVYFRKVAGRCGAGWAMELQSYLSMMNELIAPELVLADPDHAEIPGNPSARWAIMASLMKYTKASNFDRVIRYIGRFPVEYPTSFIIPMGDSDKAIATTPAYQQWLSTVGVNAIL